MISLQTGQPLVRFQPAQQTGTVAQPEIYQYGDACAWQDRLVAIAVQWRNRDTRETTDEVLLFDAENGDRVGVLTPVPGARTKGARFGRAIAINDALIAVSTTGADIKTGYFGRVDLCDRETLVHLRTFTRPDNGVPYNDGAFGSNVALHDNWIIITANFDSEVGREGDTVWIYDVDTGTLVYRFAASGNNNASLLGRSFDIYDGMILLGEPWTRADGKSMPAKLGYMTSKPAHFCKSSQRRRRARAPNSVTKCHWDGRARSSRRSKTEIRNGVRVRSITSAGKATETRNSRQISLIFFFS